MLLTTTNNRGMDLVRDFDNFFNSFLGENSYQEERYPLVNVKEEEDNYLLEAELPGMDEKDIEISVHNGVLSLSAEEMSNEEKSQGNWLVKERRKLSFSRKFALPKDADSEKISANYSNGVLVLSIGKKEDSKPRTIQIGSMS